MAHKVGTVVRLLREDRGEFRRALTGRTERMIVFAVDLRKGPIVAPTTLEFRELSANDLRELDMPKEFRAEQLDRMTRLGGCYAFGVFCDGVLAHTSWLYDRNLERRSPPSYLDLSADEREISACVTLPEFRGRGVYPVAIQGICAVLRTQGVRRVYMKTDPSNSASQRGIEKAGLTRAGEVLRVVLPFRPSGRGILLRRFTRR